MDQDSWRVLCEDMCAASTNSTRPLDLMKAVRSACYKTSTLRFMNEYATCTLVLYLAEIYPEYCESLLMMFYDMLICSKSSEEDILKIVTTSRSWFRRVFVRQSHEFWRKISMITMLKCTQDLGPKCMNNLKIYVSSLNSPDEPCEKISASPREKRMKMDTDIPNSRHTDWLLLAFQYLDPVSLGHTLNVSKSWNLVGMNDQLWHKLFRWPIKFEESSQRKCSYHTYIRRHNAETKLNSQRIRRFGSKRTVKSKKRICPYSTCFKILSSSQTLKRHVTCKHDALKKDESTQKTIQRRNKKT